MMQELVPLSQSTTRSTAAPEGRPRGGLMTKKLKETCPPCLGEALRRGRQMVNDFHCSGSSGSIPLYFSLDPFFQILIFLNRYAPSMVITRVKPPITAPQTSGLICETPVRP